MTRTGTDTDTDTDETTRADTESMGSATDADVTAAESTGGPDTGGVQDPLNGLCPDIEHLCAGDPWQVEPCDDCDQLTPTAECVLSQLSSGIWGEVTTVRCEPECTRDHYILRGGGSHEVLIESKALDGEGNPTELTDRVMCSRVDPMFFQECLNVYSEDCADPSLWVVDCVDFDSAECPFGSPP